MGYYVANMDLWIDGELFHCQEPITAKIRKSEISFLLAQGMILEKEEQEHVNPEKEEQEPAGQGKRKRKQSSKTENIGNPDSKETE